MVLILSVAAEGGHLYRLVLDHSGHCAVLYPRVDKVEPGKGFLHLLRLCIGTDVKIVGLTSEQLVSHTAAHDIGFKARELQQSDHLVDIGRYLYFFLHIFISKSLAVHGLSKRTVSLPAEGENSKGYLLKSG